MIRHKQRIWRTINNSGQALIIASFIGLLILLVIPAIVLYNQVNANRQAASERREKGYTLAREGLNYAVKRLAQPQGTGSVLSHALTNDWSGFPECSTGTVTTGSNGGHFKLTCDRTNAENYQVRIVATALLPGTVTETEIPTRALEAYFSRRTMALALPSGYQTSTAVQLSSNPVSVSGSPDGLFLVYWGPLVIQDLNLWTIPNPSTTTTGPNMNLNQFPRKFSQGGIYGGSGVTAPATNTDYTANLSRCNGITCDAQTDQKEYWAYNDLGAPLMTDLGSYTQVAKANSNITPPKDSTNASINATPNNSGYFSLGAQPPPAIFDATSSTEGYTVSASTDIIYVSGNTQFNRMHLDLKTSGTAGTSGALIIDGNLTVADILPFIDGFNPSDLRIPPTAEKDYPYTSPANCAPVNLVTYPPGSRINWSTTGLPNFQFRGFLHVTHNMTVKANRQFRISGALRVDGLLTVEQNAQLIVSYDDEIGHNILVPKLEIQTDSIRDVAPI